MISSSGGLSRLISFLVFISCLLFQYSLCELENETKYRIKSVEDNLYLTATRDPRHNGHKGLEYPHLVLTLPWKNSTDQSWETRWYESKEDKYLHGILLLSETKRWNKVSLWIEKEYPVYKEWEITNIEESAWIIKNKRTEKCISNMGTGLEVEEIDCELQSKKQLWTFEKYIVEKILKQR